MEFAGLTIVLVVFTVLISLFIQAGFLLWGAKLAGIGRRTYGKAIGTLILAGIASVLLSWPLSSLPIIGAVAGSLGGFLITALIMMALFDTTFGKALGATVIAWVLGIIVLGGIALLLVTLAGGMAAFS
jgi:hypothetical protein